MIVKQIHRSQRDSHGSLFAVAFICAIPLMMAIGAFSVDTMHYNAVQAEVQRACDAGALAGAMDMWEYQTNKGQPVADAILVAGMNDADGRPVANASGASVNAFVETKPTPTVGGTVRCSIRRPYQNLLAAIFGNFGCSTSCTALAGPQGTANVASYAGLFPLAVGLNTKATQDGQSLNDKKNIGDTIYLDWHGNVEWTGFDTHNAKDVGSYITGYMNPGSSGKASPTEAVGDPINLTHGVQDSNVSKVSPFVNDVLYLPVVDDSGGLKAGDYKILGFIGIQVQSVINSGAKSYIMGTISASTFRGSYDPGKPTVVTPGILSTYKTQPAKLLN